MVTRDVFSEDELAQLRGFPGPARAELIRYFTLAPADELFVRKFRRRENVMGAAVQLDPHRFRRHHPKWHDGLRGENRKWDRPVRSTPRNIRMRLWSW